MTNLTEYKKKLYEPLRQATLCFLLRKKEILLARKKRGFAVGKWNGVGGKVMDGESIETAAKRETFEEIGVTVDSLKKVAVLNFYFTHNNDWNQQVIVFKTKKWKGEPIESEEMAPQWYPLDQIPYKLMWWDDILWLPMVLNGKTVEASFLFNDNENILDYTITETDF